MTYQFDFRVLFPYWADLLSGCGLTLAMTCLSAVTGFSLAIAAVMAGRSRHRTLNLAAVGYIEAIRYTPFLVQVLFIYFGLPAVGFSLSAWPAGVLALSLNFGAFAAEIVRGGVDGIPKGQFEAGAALGLHPLQVLRFVILKPALRIIYPALSSQFVLLLLTSSIVSAISAEELTATAQSIDTLTFRSFEIYIVATTLYLLMATMISQTFKAIERRAFAYPVK